MIVITVYRINILWTNRLHITLSYAILLAMSALIDSLDLQLISLLEKDAHQSSSNLGKQLGLSSSGIRRRVSRLIKEGVVRITTTVDPVKVGFPLETMMTFDVAHGKLDSVVNLLGSKPEIRWLSATSGRFDVIALAWFHSTDHLYDFMRREIGEFEGIRNVETFICLHVQKRHGLTVI